MTSPATRPPYPDMNEGVTRPPSPRWHIAGYQKSTSPAPGGGTGAWCGRSIGEVMSLSPGEREALNQIEGRLSRSDPRLAAMLSSWTAGRVRGWLARLPLPARWRSPRELARVLIVAVGLGLVVGLAIVSVLRAPASRSPGRQQPYSSQGTRGTQGTPASDYPYGVYP